MSEPNDRDWLIYKQVKMFGWRQSRVARDFQLHFSRISQIVRHVNRWLAAGGKPADPELCAFLARREQQLAIQRERLVQCLELATRALESHPSELKTIRRRYVNGKLVNYSETSRQQPTSALSIMSVLIKASAELQKLDEKLGAGSAVSTQEKNLSATQGSVNPVTVHPTTPYDNSTKGE
jgi:hypothetical protein